MEKNDGCPQYSVQNTMGTSDIKIFYHGYRHWSFPGLRKPIPREGLLWYENWSLSGVFFYMGSEMGEKQQIRFPAIMSRLKPSKLRRGNFWKEI
jgi:hypothetical protein